MTSDPSLDQPFLMAIEGEALRFLPLAISSLLDVEVFSVLGRGTVATGRVRLRLYSHVGLGI